MNIVRVGFDSLHLRSNMLMNNYSLMMHVEDMFDNETDHNHLCDLLLFVDMLPLMNDRHMRMKKIVAYSRLIV